jgi:hypothetical protein
VYPQFNEAAKFGNVHIEVGMEFDNLATFNFQGGFEGLHHTLGKGD